MFEHGLISEDRFRTLSEVAFDTATADHVLINLRDRAGGTTRLANNEIVQNVDTRRQSLGVEVAFGKRVGRSRTTNLTRDGVVNAVRRAEAVADAAPEDPEYLPPLPPQEYPVLATFRADTAEAGPAARIEAARRAVRLCAAADLEAAGIVESYTTVAGVAATTGLFAYEPRTAAAFSLTATGTDSTGWVNAANRSFAALDVTARTRVAIEKARLGRRPREIPAGPFTVILEPAAVAGLVAPMLWMLDAKAYEKGTSPYAGKLNEPVVDRRLTLQNRPDHPDLLGDGFTSNGLPNDYRVWIEDGVLRQLDYDRYTAEQAGVAPTPGIGAPHLSAGGEVAETVAELVRGTELGILVTNFWYIRFVNPRDLTLTGMTRDGTYLIENGEVSTGLINFRWHESPLRALNRVRACTRPLDSITTNGRKMMLPAIKTADFNFSSVTRF